MANLVVRRPSPRWYVIHIGRADKLVLWTRKWHALGGLRLKRGEGPVRWRGVRLSGGR